MSTSTMPFPCLAFHSVVDRSTVLFSPSEKKPIAGGDMGQLENMTICPTTHGFVLARDPATLATFLWSPLIDGGKIDLPPLAIEIEDGLLVHCTCLLSGKPTAPDCVVLLVEPDAPYVWYCHAGDSQWEVHEYDIGTQLALPEYGLPEEDLLITPIAACHGKFYFNCTTTSLGVIDFCGAGAGAAPVFGSIAMDDTMDDNYGYDDDRAKEFLLESDDDLYMVRLLSAGASYSYRRATVHVLDFSTRRWRRVDDLGGRTFLLSEVELGTTTTSQQGGDCGLQPDCIYYAGSPRRKSLHIFNVKDNGSAELQKLDEAPTEANKAFWMFFTDLCIE